MSMFLTACGEAESTNSNSVISNSTQSVNSTSETQKLNFENVSFEDATFTYDGKSHILGDVVGAPEGTHITYTGREAKTDVGTYNATAKLEKENYNAKTLEAKLIINPADFSGLTYDSVSVTYDGENHINDIQLVGFPPEGTTSKEVVKNVDDQVVTEAIEVGKYYYTLELTNKNYNKATFTATLNIKANKTDMPVFAANDGNIYFANGLDNRYLYKLDASSNFERIDYSTPKEFNKYNSSSALFIAGSPLLNAVKEVKDGETQVLYTDSNIDDFVKYNESIYYYSSNSLTAAKSGIYKVDATNTDAEPIVTKVFEGKSDNLTIYGGNLYFANKNDHSYLYKMNLSTNTESLVLEEKVHEFIIENNKLYCTVNGTINDYIGYLDLSSNSTEPTKLTNVAGEFLKIKNGYLYFNYTDLFSFVDESKKGIWKINLSSKERTQVLPTENVNGFDIDSSSNIVYIDTNDLHLYRYNVNSQVTTDLLADFVITEDTPINLGGRTIAHGSKIYYLNMYAGKTLYMYDEGTKQNTQLTANKVEDFFINEDILFFNQVTRLTNNDLYCVDLKMGQEAVKVSSNDVRNMISDGTYIYATHYNWVGVSGGISRMKLDGSEYVKFSEINGAKNLTIRDGKLYFINCSTGQDNGYIEYYNLSDITAESNKLTSTRLTENIKNVKQFIFDGDNIFYIYNGTIENSIRRSSFTTLDAGIAIASSKTNPNEMILHADSIIYYSYAATAQSSAGFYKVNKNAIEDKTQELILGYDKAYYGSNLSISNAGYLYFLNYIPKLLLGNAHTYQINLSNADVMQLD